MGDRMSEDDFYFKVIPTKNSTFKFIGMAKMKKDGVFVTDDALFEPAPSGLWFEFGDDKTEVLESLKAEVSQVKISMGDRIRTAVTEWIRRNLVNYTIAVIVLVLAISVFWELIGG